MNSPEYPDLPFVRPRAWGQGRDGHSVQVIVVHYTAGSERSTSAEDGAAYDQRRTDGTSTHYFVDQNSIVQCVETWNRANAALHTGNRIGIQYELCGTQQTRPQWLDSASDSTITNAARQIARDCAKYGIPAVWLSPGQVRAGVKGICGHADITLAFPGDHGDHMDPGSEFPRDVLIQRVADFMAPPTQAPAGAEEDDDMATLWHVIDTNGTKITTDDGVIYAHLQGGRVNVGAGLPQSLANKMADPPAAGSVGTGDSNALTIEEWNAFLGWFGVQGWRADASGNVSVPTPA